MLNKASENAIGSDNISINKEELEFWIIEPKKIEKILSLIPVFDYTKMKNHVPRDNYVLMKDLREKNLKQGKSVRFFATDFQEYSTKVIEKQKEFINFITTNLQEGFVILCSFEQS